MDPDETVSADEALLARTARGAGRLAVALVREPFAAETALSAQHYVSSASEVSAAWERLAAVHSTADVQRRIDRLAQCAVDGRPGSGA